MDGIERAGRDVVVVGAGIVGLACGWRAAQRGLSTLVLDRAGAGAGASGVAAGMLAPQTEADFGEERLLRLNVEARSLWGGFAAELEELTGAATSFTDSGALLVAAERDDVAPLRRLHELQRSLDLELELEVEWLSARECRRLEPGLSPRVAGGLLASRDGHVDPAATVQALAAALRRAGGELAEGVAVRSIDTSGERVTGVSTDGGSLAAEQVVIAAGCWSGELAGQGMEGESPPVRPVKGQILELRARDGSQPLARRLVRTPRCYVVSRTDGRVVIGATVEERGFDTTVTAEGVHRLLEAAWEVLPDVGELELVGARAGLRPGTPDNAPAIGPGAVDGLIWATGHYRNGVLLAPLTAGAVAALVAGDEPSRSIASFAPDRFDRSQKQARVGAGT